MRLRILAVAALLCGGTAMAGNDSSSDAASLLFESPHWARVQPGGTLVYQYVRKSADPERFGSSFENQIRLYFDRGATDATRTVRVKLFGPARRRASGPFEDVSSNPVLMLFLEDHVEQLSRPYVPMHAISRTPFGPLCATNSRSRQRRAPWVGGR